MLTKLLLKKISRACEEMKLIEIIPSTACLIFSRQLSINYFRFKKTNKVSNGN